MGEWGYHFNSTDHKEKKEKLDRTYPAREGGNTEISPKRIRGRKCQLP